MAKQVVCAGLLVALFCLGATPPGLAPEELNCQEQCFNTPSLENASSHDSCVQFVATMTSATHGAADSTCRTCISCQLTVTVSFDGTGCQPPSNLSSQVTSGGRVGPTGNLGKVFSGQLGCPAPCGNACTITISESTGGLLQFNVACSC